MFEQTAKKASQWKKGLCIYDDPKNHARISNAATTMPLPSTLTLCLGFEFLMRG